MQGGPLKRTAAHAGVQVCLADDEPASVRIAPYRLLAAALPRRVAFLGTRNVSSSTGFASIHRPASKDRLVDQRIKERRRE